MQGGVDRERTESDGTGMIESLTIGQAAAGLALVVAIIAGLQTLKKNIKSWLDAALKDQFAALEKTQKDILARLDVVDKENCKNYLVTFLAEVARGEMKDETEMQRFWEEYEHYTAPPLKGNSYITHKVEELKGRKLL